MEYHDSEWGVPSEDDSHQFEHHILEIFQAGLNWRIMLQKRKGFQAAFAGFDPHKVAKFGPRDVKRLLGDAAIIRNRQKIAAAMNNAPLFLDVSREFGGFHGFLEQFRVKPVKRRSEADIPATTKQAEAMSKELKRRGFKFVGPTICYAHMQSVGIVNDHTPGCFRHGEINRLISLH